MTSLIKVSHWLKTRLTRREICSILLQGLAAGGFFHVTWKYLQGMSASSLEITFSELPRKGEVIFDRNVYLLGLHGGVKALSARCPHLGCRLAYNATDRYFLCPCHGSFFSLEGRWLGGPAKKDMVVLNLRADEQCGTYKVILPLS